MPKKKWWEEEPVIDSQFQRGEIVMAMVEDIDRRSSGDGNRYFHHLPSLEELEGTWDNSGIGYRGR